MSELQKKDPDHRIWSELCKFVENRGFFYPKLKIPLKNVLIKAASFSDILSHVRGKIYFTLGHYLEMDEDQKKYFLLKASQDDSPDAILNALSNEILESAIAIDTNQISIDEISKFAAQFYEAVKKNHPAACLIMWIGLTKFSIGSVRMCLVDQVYFPRSQMYFFWDRLLPAVLTLNSHQKVQDYLDIAIANNHQIALQIVMEIAADTNNLNDYIIYAKKLYHMLEVVDDSRVAHLRWHGEPKQILLLKKLSFVAHAFENGTSLDLFSHWISLISNPIRLSYRVDKNIQKALDISQFLFEAFISLNSGVVNMLLTHSGEYIDFLTNYPALLCVNYSGFPADLKKAESLFHTAARCAAHAHLPGVHNYVLKEAARYLQKPKLIEKWQAEFPSFYLRQEAKVGLR